MQYPPRFIPKLTLDDLTTPERLNTIYHNLNDDYYWSDDFSPEFYTAQAQAGFIAVTEIHQGEEILLPELQRSYALLDFEHLHIGRHARRILRRDRPTLHIGTDLRIAYDGIRQHHKHSWLTPRYLDTLEQVNRLGGSLQVLSVLLQHNGMITAGEIGYTLGRTYTSLSGFTTQEPHCRNHGTVQLVMLGQWLQQQGFAFWNLGQPYMAYKFALGAKEYTREAFLKRWLDAIPQSLPTFPKKSQRLK